MLSILGDKKLVLYGGNEKILNDIKWLFKEIDVLGNITSVAELEEYDRENTIVIICSDDNPDLSDYKEGVDYLSLKDIADDLGHGKSLERLQKNREVAFWGTGAIAECYKCIQGIYPSFYIDSNNEKKEFCEKKIVTFEEASIDKRSVFIVVMTDNYYYQIDEFLSSHGFIEGEDYIYFRKLLDNSAGDMFLQTLYDTPKDYRVCDYPFNRVVIYENGDVTCCCEGMQISYGNIVFDTGDEVWNSTVANIIRLSIVNKTYSFCRKDMCPYLMCKVSDAIGRNDGIVKSDYPEWVGMGIDYTCNLYCQSCRRERRVATGESLKRIQNVARKIDETDWLNMAKRLSIAGMGEALFSPTYKKMIFENIDGKRKSITIGTNGMLVSKEIIEKLNSLYEEVSFSVSIDAATDKTYQKLRRGGVFERVKENIDLLYRMKKEGMVKNINMVFVVQKENYEEMKAFAEWGMSVDAIIIFYALHNWGTYSEEEFADRSMIDVKTRKLKPQLEEIMRDPIWNNKKILIDEIRNCRAEC